jgi:hypothetical protein
MSQRTSTILEVISAIAVVLSLIFVAFEIRNSSEQVEQNTRVLQITAYQDLIGRIVEINAISIEESTTIESLIAKESPTEKEIENLNSFLWILFRHGDMAYFQYEQGAISEERLQSAMAPILTRLEYPFVVARWNNMERAFVPSYRRYIREQIENIPQVSNAQE